MKIRARRKIGEISKNISQAQGKRTDKEPLNSTVNKLSKKESLEKAGVPIILANRCEQIADIDEAEFEAVINDAKEKDIQPVDAVLHAAGNC